MPETIKGHIVDPQTGLIIPKTYQRSIHTSSINLKGKENPLNLQGFNQGFPLPKDREYSVVKFPHKGSGLDDLINQAIADGNVSNVGVAPVIHPQITALIARQQAQASTASLTITGREGTVKRVSDLISRFNDSPIGWSDGISQFIYNMRTYNRGCPIATIPIHADVSEWSALGLTLIPILQDGEKESDAKRFHIENNTGKPIEGVPYILSPFDIEPTGNVTYPYWYRAKKTNASGGASYIWVLLHNTQVIVNTPSSSSSYGVGTSAIWTCLGFLAESILILDERLERQMNALTEGLIGISGTDSTAKQIKAEIAQNREKDIDSGRMIARGYTMLTSPNTPIAFAQLRFREDAGIEFKERRQYEEDVIALCFGEPLSSVVTRGGVGFGAQAETVAEQTSDSGVNSLLSQLAVALGSVYRRVSFAIKKPSNREKQAQMETLLKFLDAVGKADGVFDVNEVRAIIERDIMEIPIVDEGDAIKDVGADADVDDLRISDDDNDDNNGNNSDDLDDDTELSYNVERAVMLGDYLLLVAQEGVVLYHNGEVIITDGDVDLAIEESRLIDPVLADLMEAERI